MTNSTELHDIIFVTDKYGRRNKTGDGICKGHSNPK